MSVKPGWIGVMADSILVLHLAIVLFITAGLPLIYIGAAMKWSWVREWRWRALHVAAVAFVAGESLVGVDCPLTVWEDNLRGRQSGAGFIERGVHAVLFYDAPAWVFTMVYVAFAALVVLSWIIVRPVRTRRVNRRA
jgi:Protein of Unknown function (DUF2784)